MARRLGYLYGSEQDFDDAKRATRIVLGIDTTSGAQLSKAGGIVYAEVTELRAGKNNKQAKAELRIFNATTQAFEAPTRPFYFNSDNAATADATTTDIFSSDDLTVGEVYEVIPYGDSSESEQWMAKPKGGGGASLVYLELTASTDINTYTGTIYDNPVDRNSITVGVTVKAIQHDAGTLPNSAAGKGWFATLVGGIYYIQPAFFPGG